METYISERTDIRYMSIKKDIGLASANAACELLSRKGMAHFISYPTPGETSPALPRERAASSGCGDRRRRVGADAPPQGDSCALRKQGQSMLGIQSIRKIPAVVGRLWQSEESIVRAGGFTLTGFPTGKMDMSPAWLWHHCDLTYRLKITGNIHLQLFFINGWLLSPLFNWCV